MAAEVEAETRTAPERILESACDLIAAEGIDEVRIARVATRAGASTALVHHYFSTREELLEQALIHSFEQAGDERFQRPPDTEESATEALARGIDECLPLPGPPPRGGGAPPPRAGAGGGGGVRGGGGGGGGGRGPGAPPGGGPPLR